LVSFMTYHKISKMLYVTFKNGTLYLYNDVDRSTFEDVRDSDSIGKALHSKIFGVFKYEKV
jgi:hypothetical protein